MEYETVNGICEIEYEFDGVTATINCIFNTQDEMCKYKGSFFNVTNLKINNIGKEIIIYGFDIIDHKNDGWLNENRYYVYDYESDSISFYCEDFNIIQYD